MTQGNDKITTGNDKITTGNDKITKLQASLWPQTFPRSLDIRFYRPRPMKQLQVREIKRTWNLLVDLLDVP